MNKEINQERYAFQFRFQPLIAFRKWHDLDVSLLQFTIERDDSGQIEKFLTLFGLGFGVVYNSKKQVEKVKEKSLEEISKEMKVGMENAKLEAKNAFNRIRF